jgi:predicted phage tail protein
MIDKQTAEQDASWLGARLREPSTYAGLSLLLGAIFHLGNAAALAGDIQTIGIGIGMILGGALAIVLPEQKNQKNQDVK